MPTPLPLSPFVDPDRRFMLDEDAFLAEIDPPPAFLSAPRPEYMRAAELMPIVDVIGSYMAALRGASR